MSDGIDNPGTEESTNQQKEEEDFVPKKAYLEVTQDMHKYKKDFKTTQAELNELRMKLEEQQRQRDEEQENWKKLYEESKAKAEESASQLSAKEKRLTDMVKLNAVRSQIGELVKDDFLKFVPLDKVEVDENGLPDNNSVKEVAEWFKQEFPMTLKRSSKGSVPATAPTPARHAPTNSKKSYKNKDELKHALANKLLQEQN